MSAKDKDCAHGGEEDDYQQFLRRLGVVLLALITIVGLIIFLVWAILRPSKPYFVLQDVTVFGLNATSSPNLLSLSMQVTISSRNPNDRIGIYYLSMDVYGAYRGQQVTLPTLLPPSTYQGHRDVVVWSPFLSGDAVPVAPDVALSLQQDQNVGAVLFNVKIDGQVKWKVGTWISGRYHLNVNCPAFIKFRNPDRAIAVGSAMKFQIVQSCIVEV